MSILLKKTNQVDETRKTENDDDFLHRSKNEQIVYDENSLVRSELMLLETTDIVLEVDSVYSGQAFSPQGRVRKNGFNKIDNLQYIKTHCKYYKSPKYSREVSFFSKKNLAYLC